MAKETEEIVLKFEVEQGDALTELERTKKSILGIKQEQQELNKAYKQGNITLDEYVQDSVRLEGILKKQQSSYNGLQKSVTGVQTQLDKLIKSNEKVSKDFQKSSQAFQDAAKNINIAGVSVGDITAKLASFANPATAAAGLVSGLGALYLSSAAGARDFERAQNQLSTATTVASNAFGSFIDQLSGGDGSGSDGFLSSLTNNFLQRIAPVLAALGEIGANAKRSLKELEILEIESKRFAKQQLDQAEAVKRDRDDQDKSLEARYQAAKEVAFFIDERERKLVQVQRDILAQLQTLLALDKDNLDLKKQIKQVEFEIADIQEDSQGKRTEALTQELALEKQIAEQRRLNAITNNPAGTANKNAVKSSVAAITTPDVVASANLDLETYQTLNETTAELDRQRTDQATREAGKRFEMSKLYADLTYQTAVESGIMINDALAGLFKEGSDAQKFFAISSLAISTADAIAKATAAAANVPFPGNLAAIAASVATVLGNIATAESYLSRAAGGGDFMTNGPSLLLVGDNPGGRERVTVEPISGKGETKIYGPNLMAMAGGGTLTTNPGGLISNSLTSDINTQLMMANMFKMMPTPEVSVKEITKVQTKIRVKESSSSIGGRRNAI
jgi:uncharacterized protein YoxC